MAVVIALALAATACTGGTTGGQASGPFPSTAGSPSGPELEIEGLTAVEALAGPGETVVATAAGGHVVARAEPSADAEVLAAFVNPRPTGGPLVFSVVGPAGGNWLQVLLPIRPNGTTGWIQADGVSLSRNPYRVEISTGAHRLAVLRNDRPVLDTEVAIGTGATPTPIGTFYLTELLRPPDPTGPYGTHAFGLSGYSETLQEFNGGDGVIGIHGTNDPASLGSDVSHGCVRVANSTIDELARLLPLGTPVVITE